LHRSTLEARANRGTAHNTHHVRLSLETDCQVSLRFSPTARLRLALRLEVDLTVLPSTTVARDPPLLIRLRSTVLLTLSRLPLLKLLHLLRCMISKSLHTVSKESKGIVLVQITKTV
jgi:hypothetical protein